MTASSRLSELLRAIYPVSVILAALVAWSAIEYAPQRSAAADPLTLVPDQAPDEAMAEAILGRPVKQKYIDENGGSDEHA